MYGTYSYIENVHLLQNNFLLLVGSIAACSLLAYGYEYSPLRFFFKHETVWGWIISALTHIMIISFIIFMMNGYYFFLHAARFPTAMIRDGGVYTLNMLNTHLILWEVFPTMNFNFSLDLFGFVLLFLSYVVGLISLLALDTRLY